MQRDVAARGPVGRESLALPRMEPELMTELPSAPPPAGAGPPEAAAWLARNAVDCLPEGELERKLGLGRPLRVKLGIDPTAPDIHLGFTVVLQKLREFQDLGHIVVLIIGDYTARVGDPSGRSATRPELEPEEIDANAQTFQTQALKVLDSERLEVRYNSEWLDMSMADLFRLARTTTVAQLLERDDFAKRFAAHQPISVLELLYPLLQGYDSVAVHADVELGGTDQKFNLLLGRQIQRLYGQPEQAILTMPLLTGTDGEIKMSKSVGNYIGVTDAPEDMYGKTLSIPDGSIEPWYELLLGSAPPSDRPPRDAKRALARALVARFHGSAAAEAAEAEFDRVHIQHRPPEEMPTVVWPADRPEVHLPALLAEAFGISTSEARRSLAQGGVRLDREVVGDGTLDVPAASVDGNVLQLGRRRFARVQVDRR
jgi:tyrosyl-tRNA synthetase